MLVNKKSNSRLAIYKLECSLQISSIKQHEPVKVYSFPVKGVKNGSQTFARL